MSAAQLLAPGLEEALVFPCPGGSLCGVLHGAPGAEVGAILVAGGGQYRVGSHRLYVQLARAISAAGIDVLRFDHRGVGDSVGAFRGFEYLDDDLAAALACLREARPDLRAVALVGLCDGASASLLGSRRLAAVHGLALVNPWVYSTALEARTRFSSYYLGRLQSREFWAKAVSGRLDLRASLRSLTGYLRDLRRGGAPSEGGDDYVATMLERARHYPGRMLVVLSGQDLVAQQFRQLAQQDRRWKEVLERDGVEVCSFPAADHTFSQLEHRRALEQCLARWLGSLAAAGGRP